MNKTLKVAIGYPPIEQSKGTPLLSQNRQFQYFNAPTYIYPMVPAYAASLAKKEGFEVVWMDGIAERKKYSDWLDELVKHSPDVLMLETKAPVVKSYWKIINEIKVRLPTCLVVLVGDHVTWNPLESFENCSLDYILMGGDYDFLLLDLLKSLTENKLLPGGIWGKVGDGRVNLNQEWVKYEVDPKEGKNKYWLSGPLKLEHDLDQLPFVDRGLTKWELYAYENGNYKYTPATYMYSGRDCWWNRCTFCVWDHTINPRGSYRRFSPERLFAEVKYVVDNFGVKEIFDDAGTLFVGPTLKKFCELLIASGYNRKVVYGCNMRLNALTQEYYDLMGRAGFRFVLYGMESANQVTLDKLDKGLKVEEIEEGLKMAKIAGLEPHITVMLGYPWETEEMALNTIKKAKNLFSKGYVDTMQATIVIPYPGTPLYKECVEKDWLQCNPLDYENFDMRGPVMKIPFSNERLLELTQMLYSSFFSPKYIFRKIISIRKLDDAKFLITSAKKLTGHLLDFDKSESKIKWLSPRFWYRAAKSMFYNLIPKSPVR
jgi:anaerobic magnesium-protoporphyrin IX monomethyl ester cyclase